MCLNECDAHTKSWNANDESTCNGQIAKVCSNADAKKEN